MVHSLLTLIVMERLADFSGSLFSCWEGPSHSTWVVQWFCKWLLFPCTDLEMLHPSGPHPLSTTTNRKTALIPLFPPDPLIQQNLLSPSLALKWWSQERPALTRILMWPGYWCDPALRAFPEAVYIFWSWWASQTPQYVKIFCTSESVQRYKKRFAID